MHGHAWSAFKANPLRLAPDEILVEQLRRLQSYVGNRSTYMSLLVLVLLWTLVNDANALALGLWSTAVLANCLWFYRHARWSLDAGLAPATARRLAWQVFFMRLADGILWGLFGWVTLDSATAAGSAMVVATVGAIAGGATASLSPVLPIYFAFSLPLLLGIALKLWSLGDPTYASVGVTAVLFFGAMIGWARTNYRALQDGIEARFALVESQRQLHEIERREMLSRERQRLMQDMHDGLGSSLVSALRVVERGRMGEAEVAQVLKGCLDDLKLAIDSMEPVDADLLLLLATLRYRLGPRLESTGIELHWDVRTVPSLPWLDPKNALHILRVLQEAFTNIIKHTKATRIAVRTGVEDGQVVVAISDNGQGFDRERALQSGGKGLANQMRRAESIGGTVDWRSDASGTTFLFRLPVARAAERL